MSHKLLLADDSATIQRVVELTFSGEDVEVVSVGDGEQAIARIPIDNPDIVLADIGMPKRSGYDVAAFIKGNPNLKHIPVLLLAGAFEPVDEARAEQVGCNGVLVKPFEPQHVIARVRELLDGAKGTPAQATPDIARPVERLAPPRRLEFPKREEPRPAPVIDEESGVGGLPPLGTEESLDDYFDRLDAAFSTLETDALPAMGLAGRDDRAPDEPIDVPTLDDLLAADFDAPAAPAIDLPLQALPASAFSPATSVAAPPVEPPDVTPTRAPQPPDPMHIADAAPARSLVADAFAALLAVEQGEPGAAPVRLTSAANEPAVTDALVEEVTRRVIERLAPGAVRTVVADIVADVAERLVREEIQRIRGGE